MPSPIELLHVEDEPGFADLVETYLSRTDTAFDVTSVRSVDRALAELEDRRFDCIVSDYDMPRADGLDLLESVRADDEHVPFVLFTGKGNESIAARAVTAGVSDYLQKSGGTEQYDILANRVENLVEKHRAERRVERAVAAIDSANDGIALFDGDGNFAYVNDAYADYYGYDRDELVGEPWEPLYPDQEVERYASEVVEALEADGEYVGEFTGLRCDGTRFHSRHSLSMVDDGSHVCVVHSGSVEPE